MLGNEAHHGIPLQLINDPQVGPIIKQAAEEGFEFNGAENGVIAPENHGPHLDYNAYVKDWILKDSGEITGPDGARSLLNGIVEDARNSVGYWFDN